MVGKEDTPRRGQTRRAARGRPPRSLGTMEPKLVEWRVAAAVEWLHRVYMRPLRDKGCRYRVGAYRYVAERYLDRRVSPEWVRDIYVKHRAWARACDTLKLHRIARVWIYRDPNGHPRTWDRFGGRWYLQEGQLLPETPRHARALAAEAALLPRIALRGRR